MTQTFMPQLDISMNYIVDVSVELVYIKMMLSLLSEVWVKDELI